MDDLDLKKINAMLGLPPGLEHESDLDDGELEDELEAILSGRTVPSSSRKQSGNRSATVNAPARSAANPQTTRNSSRRPVVLEQRMQRMAIDDSKLYGNEDNDDDDDEPIDENDPHLLAELSKIVGPPTILPTEPLSAQVGQPKSRQQQQLPTQPSAASSTQHPQQPFPCLILSDNHFRFKPSDEAQPTQSAPMQPTRAPPVPPLPTNYVAHDSVAQQTQAPSISPHESLPKIRKQMPTTIVSKEEQLVRWRNAFRTAALEAKRNDNKPKAIEYMKEAKKIDTALTELQSNPNADLSAFDLQPPPNFSTASMSSSDKPLSTSGLNDFGVPEEFPQTSKEEAQQIFNAPPPPSSVLEALEQRFQKFKQTLDQAQAENNASKVRRLGRIVKNYQDAIKACKQKKDYDYASLPTPPGFAEIPLGSSKTPAASAVPPPSATPATAQSAPKPRAPQPPAFQPKVVKPPTVVTAASKPASVPQPAVKQLNRSQSTDKKVSSIAEKQLVYLSEKQRLFKEKALIAKRRGDLEQAKEYLRNAKGFDPLIEATRNGLPIDVTSIPEPPQGEGDFVIISQQSDYSNPEIDADRDETFRKLEIELTSQIEMCSTNKEHFLRLGDVTSASKFEKFSIEMKKDLGVLQNNWRRGDKVPKYHYEQKSFSIVVSNTELSNTQISIEVIRAIDLPFKGEPDTFVKIEFPFPKDTPQVARTHTVKTSKNPEYKQSFMFEIDRKSRSLARQLKKCLKCEIYIKGGFFQNDQLLGMVNAPLSDLETKCQVFDSFPLTSGRKIIGGQLQLRVKVREPFLAKQVEEIREKWLVLD